MSAGMNHRRYSGAVRLVALLGATTLLVGGVVNGLDDWARRSPDRLTVSDPLGEDEYPTLPGGLTGVYKVDYLYAGVVTHTEIHEVSFTDLSTWEWTVREGQTLGVIVADDWESHEDNPGMRVVEDAVLPVEAAAQLGIYVETHRPPGYRQQYADGVLTKTNPDAGDSVEYVGPGLRPSWYLRPMSELATTYERDYGLDGLTLVAVEDTDGEQWTFSPTGFLLRGSEIDPEGGGQVATAITIELDGELVYERLG